MSTGPSFKFLVESSTPFGIACSKFTNEKHAKQFIKSSKKEGTKTKLFSLTNDGKKDKEIKTK